MVRAMNEQERADLDFLMSVPADVLTDWYSKVDRIDVEYALDLLRRAYEEGAVRLDELNMKDLSQANNILARFTL